MGRIEYLHRFDSCEMTFFMKPLAMFVLASNHFQKCFFVNAGVWLRIENKFSRNYFQLTGCFEGFNPEMV